MSNPTFLHLALILLFASCQGKEKNAEDQPSLEVLRWNKVEVEQDSLTAVAVEGNAVFKRNGKDLRIMPVDLGAFTLYLNTPSGLVTRRFIAEANPEFDLNWVQDPAKPDSQVYSAAVYRHYLNWKEYSLLNHTTPEFLLSSSFGDTLTQESFHGKVTVVNFWYYGCIPCMAEIPDLNALQSDFEGNNAVQFVSLFLDSIRLDSSKGLLFQSKGWSSQTKERYFPVQFNFDQYPNSATTANEFGVRTYPRNWVVDQDGVIRASFSGAKAEGNAELRADSGLKYNSS